MIDRSHERIEALAGAIALGEATEDERRTYREHIASCSRCLGEFGGEREIERVAATVAQARESEVWQPELGDVVLHRTRKRRRAFSFGASVLGTALCVSFGLHALLASGIAHLTPALAQHPVVFDAGTTRIVLEQSAPAPVAKPAPPARRLVVTHNVVQISRAPIPVQAAVLPSKIQIKTPPQDISAVVVHPDRPRDAQSNVPIWRRGDSAWRTVARTTTTSLSESAPQTLTHSAESLHIATTREAAPVGGATAINPQPPMIAYDEGAEGTAVFQVSIDERGTPSRCAIVKSSGYAVLDATVCKAAMAAHYTPKIVGGRPVPGTYQDAFTFHMSNDNSNVEGVPKQIQ